MQPVDSEAWSRAKALDPDLFTPAHIKRFAERLDIRGECWLWAGHRNANGYGVTNVAGRTLLAHRVAYVLHYGPLLDRRYVLHSCDVRACCNPAHLSEGTHAENQRQKSERGRAPLAIGEHNPRAVLTAAAVEQMRREYRALRRGQKRAYRVERGLQYGVTERAIEAAVGGESWRSVA